MVIWDIINRILYRRMDCDGGLYTVGMVCMKPATTTTAF